MIRGLSRADAVPAPLATAEAVRPDFPGRHLKLFALLAVLRFIWTFNEFDDVYLLTGGGAGTEVVSIGIFNQLIGRGNIGTAAALSLVLAGLLCVLLVIYFRRTSRGEETP